MPKDNPDSDSKPDTSVSEVKECQLGDTRVSGDDYLMRHAESYFHSINRGQDYLKEFKESIAKQRKYF